ncbi:DUF1684 domain-containing protein [Streptomyces sp. NPDC048441]|uniref:DUF1684 domain-containing protein n=1 Tax=Streptomyces sp. NPDC048441 TaxID=3365552 RepID=UPI0037234E22
MTTDASTDASTDAVRDWKHWHEQRTETVSATYGPLSLTGTHWLADHPDGSLPDIPGHWAEAGDEIVLTAGADDGLTLDGQPFSGEARLVADPGPVGAARVGLGERRFVVLRREGLWAVRDFDPESVTRRAFQGIDATEYDTRWAVPGRFTPYAADSTDSVGSGVRTVRVGNADGVERGLGLGGELAFKLAGKDHTLQVSVEGDVPQALGSARAGEAPMLWAVFADASSGVSSYRFRFLRPAAPDAEGRTTVDFNRALLPPCAFADHFLCPFPPPGNTLDTEIAAGERNLLRR